LGIDGSLGEFSAALVGPGGANLGTASVASNEALERGLGAVAVVLGSLPIAEVAVIAVGTGPGSFAGTRIALSYAKGLALASGRPLAGISSYDALEPPEAAPPIVAVVPARHDLACARVTLEDGSVHRRCAKHAVLADWVEGFGRRSLWLAGLAEGDLLHLAERGCDVRTSLLTEPAALRIARLAQSRETHTPAHALEAEYGFAAIASSNEQTTAPPRCAASEPPSGGSGGHRGARRPDFK
jgi:tRNA threonylcarbamoyl adenosine modification protein YeaZ